MRKFVNVGVTLLLASVMLSAQNSYASQGSPKGQSSTFRVELHQRELASLGAQIRSHSDLQVFMSDERLRAKTLNDLSKDAQTRFIDSLSFNAGGLTSFYYQDIEDELSASQAYQLLALFGAQSTVGSMTEIRVNSALDRHIMSRVSPSIMMADQKGKACVGGACVANESRICMSNC